MNGPLNKVVDIEYRIRKYQRAIEVVRSHKYHAHQGGPERQRALMLEYAQWVTSLKRQLLDLTGRCAPESPKWPI